MESLVGQANSVSIKGYQIKVHGDCQLQWVTRAWSSVGSNGVWEHGGPLHDDTGEAGPGCLCPLKLEIHIR